MVGEWKTRNEGVRGGYGTFCLCRGYLVVVVVVVGVVVVVVVVVVVGIETLPEYPLTLDILVSDKLLRFRALRGYGSGPLRQKRSVSRSIPTPKGVGMWMRSLRGRPMDTHSHCCAETVCVCVFVSVRCPGFHGTVL